MNHHFINFQNSIITNVATNNLSFKRLLSKMYVERPTIIVMYDFNNSRTYDVNISDGTTKNNLLQNCEHINEMNGARAIKKT